jgi:ferric-dicitrate binding protein FerR (iron transport regulator)
MTTMLEQAVAHIRAGEIEKARPLLIEVLKQNPRDENAWLWMSRCVTETEQKRYCFEKVLKLNPQNQHAIRSLSYLNRPVSPPAPPKLSQQQPVQKQRWGAALLNIALFAIAIFLVLLFLYAWWLTR